GAKICEPHNCGRCGATVESRGYHGLHCKKNLGVIPRHSTANDVIARALRSAEIPCIREPTGCSRADGKHPDGMTLIPWERGRSLVWDFTCRDSFAPSYLSQTSSFPGRAAELAEKDKNKKYSFLTNQFVFVPIAIETSGVWGKLGIKFIKQLGTRIKNVTGQPASTSFLIQRLSISVQRGNVAAIMGTLPGGKSLDEIFLL